MNHIHGDKKLLNDENWETERHMPIYNIQKLKKKNPWRSLKKTSASKNPENYRKLPPNILAGKESAD